MPRYFMDQMSQLSRDQSPVRLLDRPGLWLGLVVAVLAVVLVTLGVHGVWLSRTQYEHRAATQVYNLGVMLEARLSSTLDKTDMALKTVGAYMHDLAMHELQSKDGMPGLLTQLQDSMPEVRGILVANAEGEVRFTSSALLQPGMRLADFEGFRLARASSGIAPVLSLVTDGRFGTAPTLALSRSLSDDENRFGGVAIVVFEAEGFARLARRLRIGEGSSLALRSEDLSLLQRHPALPGDAQRIGQPPAAEERPLLERALAAKGEPVLAEEGTAGAMMVLRRLPSYPLHVSVQVEYSAYLLEWYRGLAVQAAIALLLLLLVALGAGRLWQLARRLGDAELRWNFALLGSGQGVWDWDIRADRVYYSPQFKRLLGFADDELGGGVQDWLSRLHPDDLGAVTEQVQACLRGELLAYDAEYRVMRHQGEPIWVRARGMVVARSSSGEPLRMIGTLHSIDARKRAEQALREAQQRLELHSRQVELLNQQLSKRTLDAETATRAKDAFLRNIAHEFRTPLGQVMGALDLIVRGGLTERQQGFAQLARQAAEQLLRLINDTLDVARLEAGTLSLDSLEFSPRVVLQEVCLMFASVAESKGLALSMQEPQTLPERLLGDPTRIAQALLNYLDNAIKFTERGAITVSATVVGARPGQLCLRFEVADTGIGIAPEIRPQLFTAFMQGEAAVNRGYQGMGVGLFNTRKLAELMGGEVGVDSEPGQGSRFWFTAWLQRCEAIQLDSAVAQPAIALTTQVPEAQGVPKPEPSQVQPVDLQAAAKVLDMLMQQLAAGDFLSVETLAEEGERLEALLGEQALAALRREITAFDFDAALARLEALRQSWPGWAGRSAPAPEHRAE